MALSGSYDWTQTSNDIIYGAFRDLTITAAGAIPDIELVTDARADLNMMLKAWQNKDMGLWLKQEVTVFLDKTKRSYSLGPSGDNATTSYTKTELSAAGAATDITLTVDSTTGMTALDKVGVQLDAGTLHWTTVAAVGSSTQFNLTDALPSAAAIDNNIYFFTNLTQRPLGIVDGLARLRYDNLDERPLRLLSRQEYQEQTTKDHTGEVVQVYYQPTLTNGTLHVWPKSTSEIQQVVLDTKVNIQDIDQASDNIEVPPQWLMAVRYGLALLLGRQNGTPPDIMEELRIGLYGDGARVPGALAEAQQADDDGIGFQIVPDWRGVA